MAVATVVGGGSDVVVASLPEDAVAEGPAVDVVAASDALVAGSPGDAPEVVVATPLPPEHAAAASSAKTS